MIHPILKMGDPRLLRVSEPIKEFDTPALHELIKDMFETMRHANGAGLTSATNWRQFAVGYFWFPTKSSLP